MFPLLSLGRCLFLAALLLSLTGLSRASDTQTLLVFGDSLSSGYRMDSRQSWPALLQRRLEGSGRAIRVINASRKGETTQGGLERLPAALDTYRPRWVLLELGANDGLRQHSLASIKRNLVDMVTMIQSSGALPILVSMELPPGYDPVYALGFRTAYLETAQDTKVPLVPFLLQKLIHRPDLFFPDRRHPTPAAQAQLLDVVWPVVDPLLAPP